MDQNQIVNLLERFLKGEFNDNPVVQRINNMIAGKSNAEQIQILLNMLASIGFDINQKIHIPDELARKYGLIP